MKTAGLCAFTLSSSIPWAISSGLDWGQYLHLRCSPSLWNILINPAPLHTNQLSFSPPSLCFYASIEIQIKPHLIWQLSRTLFSALRWGRYIVFLCWKTWNKGAACTVPLNIIISPQTLFWIGDLSQNRKEDDDDEEEEDSARCDSAEGDDDDDDDDMGQNPHDHQQQTDFLPPLLLKEAEWLSAILYSP